MGQNTHLVTVETGIQDGQPAPALPADTSSVAAGNPGTRKPYIPDGRRPVIENPQRLAAAGHILNTGFRFCVT